MSRHYTAEECRQMADKFWDDAYAAYQDGTPAHEALYSEKARIWAERARNGGWTSEESPKA